MLLWFAVLALVLVAQVFDSPNLDYRLVVLGAVLPVAEGVLGGPWLLHTLPFCGAVLFGVMLVARGRRLAQRRWLGIPIGLFAHLVLDGTWARTEVFWWPFAGTGALGDLLADSIRDNLKIKRVRSDTFGYLQRSFMGIQSDRDASEAREVGEKAVQFAMWDNVDGSVAIKRPVLDYSVDYELVDIKKVAGKTRHMPDNFINAEGNGVTQDFHNYCRPLLGSNLPEPHRLRAPAVKKILKA